MCTWWDNPTSLCGPWASAVDALNGLAVSGMGIDPTDAGYILMTEEQHAEVMKLANRKLMASLVRECPPHLVIWHSSDGALTSEQMVKEIEDGTELGRQYAGDILRVCRDLLKRKSEREAEKREKI